MAVTTTNLGCLDLLPKGPKGLGHPAEQNASQASQCAALPLATATGKAAYAAEDLQMGSIGPFRATQGVQKYPSFGPPMLKLRARHSFIDFTETEVPEIGERLRGRSAPPSRKVDEASSEEDRYLEKLQDRAFLLGLQAMSATNSTAGSANGSTSLSLSDSMSGDGFTQVSNLQTIRELLLGQSAEKPWKRRSEARQVSGKTKAKALTTLMLGNLPYRVTKKGIMDALDRMGFGGVYHCHLPNANKKRPRATNLGYAFVSFEKCSYAVAFVLAFADFHLEGVGATKQCTLKPARLQHWMTA
mmetsp:Transcript_2195/g.5108  ORF Transcript_2195/g.5108 Transcript_2195/m.5108 type:complete len:301 (-) Transcript_2195:272-1174(-)|eukprot:CAMPEP_0170581268 /NCGR_PEP_ID=MMETSP0224-20130122/6947_1 /TAXON_ID=285029 /ORGANISM="Togula jolla, Strain CCCM 725" /LENGTH=300 /DNA_ID=CAMNT_0010904389 /DNA_START=42 /DNA_END=944 /DNA_ORIENTATION=-